MLRNIRRDPPWLVLALFGSGAAAIALEYNFGAANNIGAAIYPLILSGTIVLLALYGMVFGQPGPRAELDRRPFLAVVTAVLLFALVVERLGLVPAVVLCMVAAYAGQARSRYAFFLAYALVFGFGTWVLFSYGLGLPLASFRIP